MDKQKMRAFMGQFMEMTTGAAVMGVVAVADRIGLFREMAGEAPANLDHWVGVTGLQPRYLEEILSTLAAAGVVAFDAELGLFSLPDEQAACLADEASPYCLVGWTQMIPALYGAIPGVARAAREGGGVAFADFGPDMVEGIARANGPGIRVLLTRKWLPVMDDVVARLEEGIRVADVGCGGGEAVFAMAKAYPASTIVGYDIDSHSIQLARSRAQSHQLSNVRFEQCSAEEIPIDAEFDLVTTFDVIHDLVEPIAVLQRIRESLSSGGTYLMVEPVAGDDLSENLHPAGALTYAMSTLHCMTQSLAHGGAGLGAAWGPRRAEMHCAEAGFSQFERLEVDNSFNAFYRVSG
ncbi:MAG: methyltransferase domain-containing protein [Myxococcota bacterium]|nr:methyltransferase domain-containing protein [Myxococcota bacterium]